MGEDVRKPGGQPKQRHVLIIGGSSGIGLSAARLFLQDGDRVMITGSRPDKLIQAGRQLRKEQGIGENQLLTFAADASDEAVTEALFKHVQANFGRLDVLVHVAGISGRKYGDGPLDSCTMEGWRKVMETNVTSVYLSHHHALNMMMAQGGGVIVNVSSILGMLGVQDHFVTHAYAASRGAVIALSRSAAVYYAKYHIRINTVCPGLLDTPMSQRAVGDPDIRQALTWYQPLQPHVGEPIDPAAAIHFLASDHAKFITGIALPVDGGWSAQ